jgi:hypothetical protein
LSIKAVSGTMNGTQSGYSERWFWRQKAGEEVRPFAESAQTPTQWLPVVSNVC